MSAHYFKISKETPIILYGAGEVGQKLKRRLFKNGFNLRAFIDKKVQRDEILPVYKIENIPESMTNNEVVVIICLANGMLHAEVASELNAKGFDKICFLPLNVSVDSQLLNEMSHRYNNVVNANYKLFYNIPTYPFLTSVRYQCEDAVISRTEKDLTVWVNNSLVYVLNKKKWQGDLNKVFISEKLCDRNIAFFNEYTSFFRYLESGEASPEPYVKLLCKTKELCNDDILAKLRERESLFKTYKTQLNRGMEFFKDSAPLAEWNERGYFNLLDGHHRTSFLYTQNFAMIPIRISKEHFEAWCNPSKLKSVLDYMKKKGISRTYAPIAHPAFINILSIVDACGKTILSSVFEFLSGKGFFGQKVLDISGYGGYFARNMQRMIKNSEISCVEKDKHFLKLVNQLRYANKIMVKDSLYTVFAENRKYDCVFLMRAANEIKSENKKKYFLQKLSTITKKYLFFESPIEKLRQNKMMIYKYSGFNNYRKIHEHMSFGKPTEVGVFSNVGS